MADCTRSACMGSLYIVSCCLVLGALLLKMHNNRSEASAKRSRPTNMFLSERHITALTEILACHSHKWMSIGVSLSLPSSIRYLIHDLDLHMSLNNQWIVGQHEYAKAPTIENLKQALMSSTVGLGSVGYHLDDNLSEHGIYLDDESLLLSKRPLLEIVFQTFDRILVEEGKFTLLEVHPNSRNNSIISYQWVKDGLPLIEGGGCNRPILCLNSWVAEGTYVCKVAVEDGSTPAITSEPINVSVSISPLKKVLIDRYCALPEIPEDSWPPRDNNT